MHLVNRGAVPGGPPGRQALSYIVLRNDGRLFLEVGIPSSVITVVMRIDDEAHRRVGDALESGLDFVGQRVFANWQTRTPP